MNPQNPRSRARSWALQVMYAWEQGPEGHSLSDAKERTLATRHVSDRYLPYLEKLLGWVEEGREEIDATIVRHLANWRLERLTAIDRNVLRIGAAELLSAPDVPPAVAIHEAMQLATRYGSAESPRFVNGVLDAVAGSVRSPG